MQRVRSKDTSAELKLRRWLHAIGFRFRLNVKGLPGSPDLVLPKWRSVIFVHGCFWHSHDCGRASVPATNSAYWEEKLARTVVRDQGNVGELTALGWRVFVVWECELGRDDLVDRLARMLRAPA